MILECKLTFEAAHRNTLPQADERTRRLHGHSYEVTVAVRGPLHPVLGWVLDFADVKDHASEIVKRLDHYTLNDIPGMRDSIRPDVERWMTEHFRAVVPSFDYCRIAILGDCDWSPRVAHAGQGLERLSFGFAAAHFLPALPETHKCRRTHGHSFRAAITAADASRLAEPLKEIYRLLDHRLLNEVSGLDNPTSEVLAQWLAAELKNRKCAFQEIMIAETCTSCCRLQAD